MLVCINNKIINTDRIIAAEIARGTKGYVVKVYLETSTSLEEITIPTDSTSKEESIEILEKLMNRG